MARANSHSIIALPGFLGHAFESFKDTDEDYMWLRDSLHYDLTSEADDRPMARVMTYGYESILAGSQNTQNIEDLATSFLTSLRSLVTGRTSRPIIFVAHSLGGLIVKQVGPTGTLDLI